MVYFNHRGKDENKEHVKVKDTFRKLIEEDNIMSKFVCSVCGYIYEGEAAQFCPQCKAPALKFNKLDETASLIRADES